MAVDQGPASPGDEPARRVRGGRRRRGNIKRLASAVGEGSIAIALVHQVLQSSRLLKKAHLRRWRARAALRRTC